MTKLVYLIPILFIFSGCNDEGSKEADDRITPNSNEYNFTTPMRAKKTLSEDEYPIAQNICEAFQAMESRIIDQGGSLSLRMEVKNKTCSEFSENTYQAEADIVSSRGTGVSLNLASRTTRTFTDVLSSAHPRLTRICQSVLGGVNPSNTDENGNFRYQVSFYSSSGFEWVQIAEFKSDGRRFMPYLIEKSAIITPYANVNRENYGFTRSRTLNTNCNNGQSAYQFQLWL